MQATFHLTASSDALLLCFDKNWEHHTNLAKLSKVLQCEAQALKKQDWAIIDDINNWPVKSPEEIALCVEIAEQLLTMGMSHCAVCVNDIAVSKWMMQKIIPKSVTLSFFNDIEQCKQWLLQQGFDVNFGPKIEYSELDRA